MNGVFVLIYTRTASAVDDLQLLERDSRYRGRLAVAAVVSPDSDLTRRRCVPVDSSAGTFFHRRAVGEQPHLAYSWVNFLSDQNSKVKTKPLLRFKKKENKPLLRFKKKRKEKENKPLLVLFAALIHMYHVPTRVHYPSPMYASTKKKVRCMLFTSSMAQRTYTYQTKRRAIHLNSGDLSLIDLLVIH